MNSDQEGATAAAPDNFAAAAAVLDAEAAGAAVDLGAPPPPAPAPPDYATEAAQLLKLLYATVTPLWPSLKGVYTEAARAELAAAAAPLMAKYKFTLGDFLGRWGPEISFAFVAAPLIEPTITAIAADRAAKRAERAQPAAGQGRAAAPAPAGAEPATDATGPNAPPPSYLHRNA